MQSISPDIASSKKCKQVKKPKQCLQKYQDENPQILEIGVDEVGRGPLFGRVYTAAVILPKDDSFDHYKMKDSKRFTSTTEIEIVSEYIKKNALAWEVTYESESVIDDINILQATQKSMHKSILNVKRKMIDALNEKQSSSELFSFKLLVDGNYFKPLTTFNKSRGIIEEIHHTCVVKGDNTYSSIAAASIIAKVERDRYIKQLCADNPELIERYSLDTNKGYGTKPHIEGIQKYGITPWHRKSFGICKKN